MHGSFKNHSEHILIKSIDMIIKQAGLPVKGQQWRTGIDDKLHIVRPIVSPENIIVAQDQLSKEEPHHIFVLYGLS